MPMLGVVLFLSTAWLLTLGTALEYRSKWKDAEIDAANVRGLYAQRWKDFDALREECGRMAQTISQLKNTLAQVCEAVPDEPKPIKVRSTAEARRLVDQMNLQQSVESKGEANV